MAVFRPSGKELLCVAGDVTRDGQRFLMVTWDEESSVQSMTVVLNWQAGLKK